MSEQPRPFGLMLRRPGDTANPDATWGDPDRVEGIYVAPDFTIRHTDWDAAGSDPRNYIGGENDWALSLPHRCGEWGIAEGTLEDVLAEALRFRDELDQAIEALRAEIPIPEGPRWHYTVTARAADAETPQPEPWPPEGTVAVQTYVGNPPRPIGDADG